PRPRHDAPDRRSALPGHQGPDGAAGDGSVIRGARNSGPEEKTVDFRTDRLAETADGRRYSGRSAEGQRLQQSDSAAVWRAAEKRAGRAHAGTSRFHASPRAFAFASVAGM